MRRFTYKNNVLIRLILLHCRQLRSQSHFMLRPLCQCRQSIASITDIHISLEVSVTLLLLGLRYANIQFHSSSQNCDVLKYFCLFPQHTSKEEAKVCVRNYNSYASKDFITVDYLVIGGRYSAIIKLLNHKFRFVYRLTVLKFRFIYLEEFNHYPRRMFQNSLKNL